MILYRVKDEKIFSPLCIQGKREASFPKPYFDE